MESTTTINLVEKRLRIALKRLIEAYWTGAAILQSGIC
jgi:hypothetical protein